MLTVGPQQIDVLPLIDWAALVQYAEQSPVEPLLLSLLADGGDDVAPQDLADELDDLLDTTPPPAVRRVIDAALARLADAGVALAARDQPD